MSSFTIVGNLVDIFQERIYCALIEVREGRIHAITKQAGETNSVAGFILPGFVDSHVHIESSMLVPAEFARLAVVHGTVATVSDPHEIANVCGLQGVEFMIANGRTVPFKFNFGAPSCVPATGFETAGASLDAAAVRDLLHRNDILYLSEMMNFPGVLANDPEVVEKIAAARQSGKPVDGHAPGLRRDDARRYIDAGISTDHECFTAEEALDKLRLGMKILVREGSAAKNFDALVDLLHVHSANMMFCSDDKHPDSLLLGHINELCARAVKRGIDLFKVLRCACVNPVQHYRLNVGLLQQGDPADFIIVHDLEQFEVAKTYIDGQLVAENGSSLIETKKTTVINNFHCLPKKPEDFVLPARSTATTLQTVNVIDALDGQLITNSTTAELRIKDGALNSDIAQDVLKLVVVNRYRDEPVAKAFIRNTGLKKGALASSVAHDSHNIVAVGVDDESLTKAVNMIIHHQGGVSCVRDDLELIVPLPVAGLMSADDGYSVAAQYSMIDAAAKEAGSTLSSPFMTLSFMALLVIPHLKLSDRGLFDADRFQFVEV